MTRVGRVAVLLVVGWSVACGEPDVPTLGEPLAQAAYIPPPPCGMQPYDIRGVAWAGDCVCPTIFRSCERSFSKVFETQVTLGPSQTMTFRVIDATTNADPVMHVFDANGYEVAGDDNANGGLLPRIQFTAPWFAGGTYRVVVRAKSEATKGTGHLQIGSAAPIEIGIGGTYLTMASVVSGEELQTVNLPSSIGTHIAYTVAANGVNLVRRYTGGGAGGGVRFPLGGAATVTVLFSSSTSLSYARVVRNDGTLAGHDPDADKLGTELEAAIGTCSSLSGTATGKDGVSFSCALATDPADTDGDGLRDNWELLGRTDVSPTLPLPTWGANPRHKDLFAEVDFSLKSPDEADRLMSASEARVMSDVYGDRYAAATPQALAAHAATLRNPDGKPGIATHLDTGVDPAGPEDVTVYGSWGGHNAVPPIADGNGGYKGLGADAAWQQNLAPNRWGSFRYALPYSGKGGQTPVGIWWSWAIGNGLTQAHESGHANGLGHSGPLDVYAGRGTDVNCKPNYPSLMNYAYQDGPYGFSDGTGGVVFNNASLAESAAVPTSQIDLLTSLAVQFGYLVDLATGSVDWNRDGVFAPAGARVRAYANNGPKHDCEYTRANAHEVDLSTRTVQSPALARLADRLLVFSAAKPLTYSWSTGAFNCPQPSPFSCGTFTNGGPIWIDASGGADATRINGSQGAQMLVVAVGGADTNQLSWATGKLVSGQIVWTIGALLPHVGDGLSEPSVTRLADGSAVMIYASRDGRVCVRRFRETAGVWSWGAEVDVSRNQTPYSHSASGSPGLMTARLSATDSERLLALLINKNSGALSVREINPDTGEYGNTEFVSGAYSAAGRPSGVFVPMADHAFGGRLYVAYLGAESEPSEDGRKNRPLRQLWSGPIAGVLKLGMESYFDNEWTYAHGIDLLYETGVDSNLRAAWSFSDAWLEPDAAGVVRAGLTVFAPKADGIEDLAYQNYDDWGVLRVGICAAITNPQTQPALNNPTTCPPPVCRVNGLKTESETDVDCGGPSCAGCGVGLSCNAGADCASGWCNVGTRRCVASSCQDGVKDGAEEGVDCGVGCPNECRCSGTDHWCGDRCYPSSMACP